MMLGFTRCSRRMILLLILIPKAFQTSYESMFFFFSMSTFADALSSSARSRVVAPELDGSRIEQVTQWVSTAMGDHEQHKAERYAGARSMASQLKDDDSAISIPDHELVYGELSIPVLAKLFDSVEVRKGEKFLDIGSGDGALVFGAALLYDPDYIQLSRGLELVPGLLDRSKNYLDRLKETIINDPELKMRNTQLSRLSSSLENIELSLGNIYECTTDERIASILSDTTLAVCFATTWSASNNIELMEGDEIKLNTSLDGRRLPQLSAALLGLPNGARVVIVDGKLDCADGFDWVGDLRIECPDTAPYSVASLYERI